MKDNHLINVGLVFMVVNLSFGNTDSESGGGSSKQVKTMNDSPALKLKMFGGPCSGEIQYLYDIIKLKKSIFNKNKSNGYVFYIKI